MSFGDYCLTTTHKAVSAFRRKRKHTAAFSKKQSMAICGMYNYDRPSKKALLGKYQQSNVTQEILADWLKN